MDKKYNNNKITITMMTTAMLMLMMKTEMHDLLKNKAAKVSLPAKEKKREKNEYE